MTSAADVLCFARDGERAALATVVAVARSAPRPPGTKLAIRGDGSVLGAVSGGCVEASVIRTGLDVIAGAPAQLLHFGFGDDELLDVGLPCGGEIDVFVAPARTPEHDAFADLAQARECGALVTRLDDGRSVLVTRTRTRGTLGEPALDAAATALARQRLLAERSEALIGPDGVPLFVDVVAPPPRLVIVGATDVARCLVAQSRLLGWEPVVVDPRSLLATPESFPGARVLAAWPEEGFATMGGLGPSDAVVLLTHDAKIDDAAVSAALACPVPYIGVMGSRAVQEQRRARLLASGSSETDTDRLAGPTGLDLGGVTPEETALSIMAEIVAVRRGRKAGRLRDAHGPIHERKTTECGFPTASAT
jgi:xanthine dehydrogenase accessory factor